MSAQSKTGLGAPRHSRDRTPRYGDKLGADGDAYGDVCDTDMDGDGHSNGKEVAWGSDPADPASYPTKTPLSGSGGSAGTTNPKQVIGAA
jgi:hypothetical protein